MFGSDKDGEERKLEAVAKRLLATPHKPREDSKIGNVTKTRRESVTKEKGGSQAGDSGRRPTLKKG